MIKRDYQQLITHSELKAKALLMGYTHSKTPDNVSYVDPFQLAYWYGFQLYQLTPNHCGIDLVVHKNNEFGMAIEYNPNMDNLYDAILHSIALVDLGIFKEGTTKEYNWGNTLSDFDNLRISKYIQSIKELYLVKEVEIG